MKRRAFLENTIKGGAALSISSAIALDGCYSKQESENPKSLKISLAQWSLHRAFEAGDLDPVNFAEIAWKTYGIKAIEYVNQFYFFRNNFLKKILSLPEKLFQKGWMPPGQGMPPKGHGILPEAKAP